MQVGTFGFIFIILAGISYNTHSPLFFKLDPWDRIALLVLTVLVYIYLYAKQSSQKRFSYLLILFLPLGWMLYKELRYQYWRYQVLHTEANVLQELGEHFIVGYTSTEEIQALLKRGAVGGIFVTHRNAKHKSKSELTKEIAWLQAQSIKKLPLYIVSDQEGGKVSRLTPPLSQMPTLSQIIHNKPGEEAIFSYARNKAKRLSELGVNTNFSPVVDLKQIDKRSKIDLHSRIWERAISESPQITSKVAGLYSRELVRGGIVPVLKHFPGLGGVKADTHFFTAAHPLPYKEIWQTSLYPFRMISQENPGVMIMLGHVLIPEIDPQYPTSYSEKVIQSVIRQRMAFSGVLVSDDFSMGPVFYDKDGMGGVCKRALQAGLDIILVSYDPRLLYQGLYATIQEYKKNPAFRKKVQQSTKRIWQHKKSMGFSFD
ncbi:MAG: glycoside hydrolase family 3 N-terminal domain-containing protein [Spirochaetota bacterium]